MRVGRNVVLVVLLCAVGLFFVYTWMGNRMEDQEVEILVKAYDIEPSTADAIKVGQRVIGDTKRMKDLVEEVEVTNAVMTKDNKQGEIVEHENERKRNVTIRIRCHAKKNETELYSGEQLLKVGMSYVIRTEDTQFTGYIADIKPID